MNSELDPKTPTVDYPKGDNPYLNARRVWNDHTRDLMSSRQTWQVIGILALLVALTAVGGIIHIGSQSRFVPYIVAVDKIGQAVAAGPANKASPADQRVVHAEVASFINDARLVTPDIELQRVSILRLYAKLSGNDPATPKMNEWLNGQEGASPFSRATKETVSIQIESVIKQTQDTWQVDWIETTRDRQGVEKERPFRMRALVTVYVVTPTPATTEEQIRKNPLGVYVRDYSWSKQS